jgi:uracil-DNA glycosylase
MAGVALVGEALGMDAAMKGRVLADVAGSDR